MHPFGKTTLALLATGLVTAPLASAATITTIPFQILVGGPVVDDACHVAPLSTLTSVCVAIPSRAVNTWVTKVSAQQGSNIGFERCFYSAAKTLLSCSSYTGTGGSISIPAGSSFVSVSALSGVRITGEIGFGDGVW